MVLMVVRFENPNWEKGRERHREKGKERYTDTVIHRTPGIQIYRYTQDSRCTDINRTPDMQNIGLQVYKYTHV